MESLYRTSEKIAKTLNLIGGILLTAMMLLTVTDVILRYLDMPLTGTYEVMSLAGALVIGLTIAQTSLDGAHVNVDILLPHISDKPGLRKCFLLFIRLIGIGIFALMAWALYLKGNDLYNTHEVSLTLQVPIFPVAYGLSVCSLVECGVLISSLLKEWNKGGTDE